MKAAFRKEVLLGSSYLAYLPEQIPTRENWVTIWDCKRSIISLTDNSASSCCMPGRAALENDIDLKTLNHESPSFSIHLAVHQTKENSMRSPSHFQLLARCCPFPLRNLFLLDAFQIRSPRANAICTTPKSTLSFGNSHASLLPVDIHFSRDSDHADRALSAPCCMTRAQRPGNKTHRIHSCTRKVWLTRIVFADCHYALAGHVPCSGLGGP